MLKIRLALCAILGTLTLSGCESTGTINGVSEGKAVQFEYNQAIFDNDGQLKITMPDGEYFTGKFVQKSSTQSGDSWEIGEASDDDSFIFSNSSTVSSATEALLIGNRGNTMTCKFQFSNPDFGIDGGGIGSCKTSYGRTTHVTF